MNSTFSPTQLGVGDMDPIQERFPELSHLQTSLLRRNHALMVQQGTASNCHFVAALVTFLWMGGQVNISGSWVGLFDGKLLGWARITHVLKQDLELRLPFVPEPVGGSTDASEQERRNINTQLNLLTTRYSIFRDGYMGQTTVPEVNGLDSGTPPEDPDSVLDGLRALSGLECEILEISGSEEEIESCLKARIAERDAILLWYAGAAINGQQSHVYSVLDCHQSGLVVRDARQSPGISIGSDCNREGSGWQQVDKTTTGTYIVPYGSLLTANRWFLGGTTQPIGSSVHANNEDKENAMSRVKRFALDASSWAGPLGALVVTTITALLLFRWLGIVAQNLGKPPKIENGVVVLDEWQRSKEILLVVVPLFTASVGYWVGNRPTNELRRMNTELLDKIAVSVREPR